MPVALAEPGAVVALLELEQRQAQFLHRVERPHRVRQHLRHLVRAAVARGELPAGTDVELVAEMVPAVIWHHALYSLPMGEDLVDRVLSVVLP